MKGLAAILLIISFLFISSFAYATQYEIIDLGTLGGTYSYAYDINNSGQIVGMTQSGSGDQLAFLWDSGLMTDIGTLGGDSSADAINDIGQIVGESNSHAFLYDSGAMIDIAGSSYATAINDFGDTVGSFSYSSGHHGFLYENGTFSDIGTPLGFASSFANGINNAGQIVGGAINSSGDGHAFMYENGIWSDLGSLGGSFTSAYDINNSGQIVGGSRTASDEHHAFLYDNGQMIDLGLINYMSKVHISDNGLIVGGAFSNAFVYDNGMRTYLDSLGGGESFAYGINNNDQIVGWSKTATGEMHAVLWQPTVVPEPISSVLFVIGGTVLAGRRLIRNKNKT